MRYLVAAMPTGFTPCSLVTGARKIGIFIGERMQAIQRSVGARANSSIQNGMARALMP